LLVSEARFPSVTVFANGSPIDGILAVDIDVNAHFAANRFRVVASLDASGAAIWAQAQLTFDIWLGMGGSTARILLGDVDRIEIDPIGGEVRIDGRDLTSRLIAARIDQAFENQTASEIAILLAGQAGLQAAVTPTTQPVGRYYQNSHTRTALDQHARVTTAWDLLIRLAEYEGFEVWVDSETLNFAPASNAFGILLVTQGDCISLELERSIGLSNPLEVVVKSWDSLGQQAVRQTASAGGAVAADGTPTRYVIVRPNMNAAAALTLAQNTVDQMASHARTIRLEMPGDLTTTPRMALALSGTGTDFDTTYVISAVERRLSFQHGFTQSVQARSPYWTTSST
jgi:phage protein D